MREYRIRYGDFAGSHSVYESVAEFRKSNPDVPITRWTVDMNYKAIEVGDWIEAEDGYIVQVLKVAILKSGNTKNIIRTAIRFPMGNFLCYDRVKKPTRIPQFYAMFSHPNKVSFTDSPTTGVNRSSAHMIMWAEMVLNGMHPFDAYRAVFNDHKGYTSAQMMHKIIKLVHNRHVRKAIMSFLNSFSKKLKAKIPEDDIVNAIVEYWEAAKKKPGTTAHLAGIKLVKEIYQDNDKFQFRPQLPANGENTEDADFTLEEADPPVKELPLTNEKN